MLIISYLINFITKYLRKNIYNELNIRLKTFSYRDADMMRQKQRKAEERKLRQPAESGRTLSTSKGEKEIKLHS